MLEAVNSIEAVIFDLDGVIVSTDECHYQAWKKLAEEEGIYFDRQINEGLRGVSRLESLEIVLIRAKRRYTDREKEEMAARKNGYYRELIKTLTPADILPGVLQFTAGLREKGIKLAIGSSSRNSPMILERIGLERYFDATADGNDITRSKPDPEVFLVAAGKLGIPPRNCLVVEDAEAGVEAALAAGMKVLGVGSASRSGRAAYRAPDLASVKPEDVLR